MSIEAFKILYVEDDKNTREALSYYLKKRVGKLITAGTGADALLQYNTHCPEIIIVDLLLPDASGLDIIAKIREISSLCRIIITSSVDDPDIIVKTVDLGIDGYIIKPIDPPTLIEKIEKSCALYSSQTNEYEGANCDDFPEEKRVLEAIIKKSFLELIKRKSGRGPRDVTVSWLSSSIEIVSYDSYTTIEKTLLANVYNYSLLEQVRKMFYSSIMRDIESILSNTTHLSSHNISTSINVKNQVDKLTFSLNNSSNLGK